MAFLDVLETPGEDDRRRVLGRRAWFLRGLGYAEAPENPAVLLDWETFEEMAVNAIYEDVSSHEAWCAWLGGLSGPFGAETASSYGERMGIEDVGGE